MGALWARVLVLGPHLVVVLQDVEGCAWVLARAALATAGDHPEPSALLPSGDVLTCMCRTLGIARDEVRDGMPPPPPPHLIIVYQPPLPPRPTHLLGAHARWAPGVGSRQRPSGPRGRLQVRCNRRQERTLSLISDSRLLVQWVGDIGRAVHRQLGLGVTEDLTDPSELPHAHAAEHAILEVQIERRLAADGTLSDGACPPCLPVYRIVYVLWY